MYFKTLRVHTCVFNIYFGGKHMCCVCFKFPTNCLKTNLSTDIKHRKNVKWPYNIAALCMFKILHE